MAATTTICLEPEVKELLAGLKIHPDESYNSVVKRLVNNAYDWEPLSDETIKKIEEGLKDYKDGKYYTHEEVWNQLEKEEECTP
jgi:predicted transcriptional regulator